MKASVPCLLAFALGLATAAEAQALASPWSLDIGGGLGNGTRIGITPGFAFNPNLSIAVQGGYYRQEWGNDGFDLQPKSPRHELDYSGTLLLGRAQAGPMEFGLGYGWAYGFHGTLEYYGNPTDDGIDIQYDLIPATRTSVSVQMLDFSVKYVTRYTKTGLFVLRADGDHFEQAMVGLSFEFRICCRS